MINKAAMRSFILIVTFSDSRSKSYVSAVAWLRLVLRSVGELCAERRKSLGQERLLFVDES